MAASNRVQARFQFLADSVRRSTSRAAGAATAAAQRAQVVAAKALHNHIIGPMEKGFAAAKLETPPPGVVDGVDLRVLPKFVCYKAALLREKLSLQYALAIVVGASLAYFVVSRFEVARLSAKLREKEYILAPGVQDFIAVSPQSVPASHIQNAAMEFLQTFGNLNAANIDEQYARLAESMSHDLRVQFEMEAAPWRAKVKEDGIAQILSITDKEIRATNDGYYQVTAIGRKDTFVNSEHLGSVDVAIEMVLKLIPPQPGKRWSLEIVKLVSQDANTFRVKGGLSRPAKEGSRK